MPVPSDSSSARLHVAISPIAWGFWALLSLALCSLILVRQEQSPVGVSVVLRGDTDVQSRAVGTVPRDVPSGHVYQRIESKNRMVLAEYGFVNFNNDPFRISYSLPSAELTSYCQNYGYCDADLDALFQWQKLTIADALHNAREHNQTQDEFNRARDLIVKEYNAKLHGLLQSRGFSRVKNNIYVADIPEVVKRNVVVMRPVSNQISASAVKREYSSDEIISAALSLVQTGLRYENVPDVIGGRHTGGIYPPAEALLKGEGDCDTKSALLAAILLNWNRINLVGVSVPNHYLIGVLHNPTKGDAYVEYRGARYVLMEPAGPGWLPLGMVSQRTMALLKAGTEVSIQPFSVN